MDRKQALMHLRDKVVAGESRAQVEEAAFAVWPDGVDHFKATYASAAYSKSIDAAKALHEAVLPEWLWFLGNLHDIENGFVAIVTDGPYPDADGSRAYSICPARAWLLAILEALIAQEGV